MVELPLVGSCPLPETMLMKPTIHPTVPELELTVLWLPRPTCGVLAFQPRVYNFSNFQRVSCCQLPPFGTQTLYMTPQLCSQRHHILVLVDQRNSHLDARVFPLDDRDSLALDPGPFFHLWSKE